VLLYPVCYGDIEADEVTRLGGIADIVIDHKDLLSYAEPWRWRERFSARTWMHASESPGGGGPRPIDRRFEGDVELRPGLRLLHTPGHTKSSCCALLETEGGILFPSDSILFTATGEARLARPQKGSGDVEALASSVAKLEIEPFAAVAPVVVPGGRYVHKYRGTGRAGLFVSLRETLAGFSRI